jgi:hypothetical protein
LEYDASFENIMNRSAEAVYATGMMYFILERCYESFSLVLDHSAVSGCRCIFNGHSCRGKFRRQRGSILRSPCGGKRFLIAVKGKI